MISILTHENILTVKWGGFNVVWCFQGVRKGNIGQIEVKKTSENHAVLMSFDKAACHDVFEPSIAPYKILSF